MLCLAFPVHPPGRPEKSRLDELDAVTVPTLVVQGERDPFGMPPLRTQPHRRAGARHALAPQQLDGRANGVRLAA